RRARGRRAGDHLPIPDRRGRPACPLSPPTLTTGEFPASLAVSPDGRSVYVPASHNVYQYDLGADGTLSPKSPAAVGAGSVPYHVAVSANGRNVYVVNAGSGDISQYNVGPGGRLSPKSPARVATAFEPLGFAVSPDSKRAYVTNSPPEHPTGPPHVTQYDVKA